MQGISDVRGVFSVPRSRYLPGLLTFKPGLFYSSNENWETALLTCNAAIRNCLSCFYSNTGFFSVSGASLVSSLVAQSQIYLLLRTVII